MSMELAKVKIENEEELLSSLHLYVRALEFLLNKGFFRQLLLLYKEVGKTQGVKEWMEMQELLSEEEEDCASCLEKKKNMLRALIFQLDTSRLMEALDKLHEARERARDLEELLGVFK